MDNFTFTQFGEELQKVSETIQKLAEELDKPSEGFKKRASVLGESSMGSVSSLPLNKDANPLLDFIFS